MHRAQNDLLTRWPRNPLITLEDIPYSCNTVFNGGVIKFNGKYIMLLRVEGLEGHSVIVKAWSEDGYHFTIDKEACLEPGTHGGEEEPYKTYESMGLEDPRIMKVEDTYYVMYTVVSPYGPRLGLAKTEDFETYERIGIISGPGNKDGMLFTRKINGMYARLDRPIGQGVGNIWISYSPDLIHWGDSRLLMEIRPGRWDGWRIGASAPPFETPEGWMEIYHGVRWTSGGPIYRLGAALLDLEDPSKLIGRSAVPILSPRKLYERVGDINNVVFSCGAVVEDNNEVKVYYGAADTNICVATATVDQLIESCK